MRLRYNILWFENDDDWVNSIRPRLERYLLDLGFTLETELYDSGENLEEIINNPEINLILIDENLEEGEFWKGDGKSLIERIRQNELYTEIIFYSGISVVEITKGLEGVYLADRDNIFEKTTKIIDLTIKKNQDISNIRGLFIAEAIDIAGQMEEILSEILKMKEEARRFFINEVVQEEFFTDYAKYKIIQRFLKQKIKSLKAQLQSASNKKGQIKEILSQLEEVKEKFNQLEKEVIIIRNELAHAKVSPDKRDTLICRNKEKLFDQNKCKEIRKTFLKHQENLNKLAEIMDASV